MKSSVLVTFLLCNLSGAWCANILGIFVMPSYSHYVLGHRLMEELASKGHDVTMISPYKLDKKIDRYHEVVLDGLADIIGEKKSVFLDMEAMLPIEAIIICYKLGHTFTNFTLKHQPVLDLINSNKKFDVVVMEQFLNEALVGIPHKLNAPLVYLTTLGTSIWSNHLVANPAPLSHIPNFFLGYTGRMNFFQRLNNFFLYVLEELYRRFVAFPVQERLLHETFPDAPDLHTLIYSNDPLIVANSHISTNDPIPHVPNMIEIGGFHIKKQELTAELKEYLDKSTNGVVFFSMGSNLKSAMLPVEKREVILKALGKLKENVLWKWEEDSLPGQPANVKTMKWLPQQAVLDHPNTRAFISHGGLLSTIEAVHFGVPILGVPIFADQKMNINVAANRGYAISVPFQELTEERLSESLEQILHNVTYRDNVKTRSELMRDRPVHPMQEAVFWVEHVIKHKGAKHMRSTAMDLKWYQYEMLDVALFLIIVSAAILFSIYFVIRGVVCKFTGKCKHSITNNNKKVN